MVLLVWVYLKETLRALRLLALLSTFCGIYLVIGGYDPSTLNITPFVFLTGLLSGLSYGLYSIFGKLLSRNLSPVMILSYALGIGPPCSSSPPSRPFAPRRTVLRLLRIALHTRGGTHRSGVRAVYNGAKALERRVGDDHGDRRTGGGGRDRGRPVREEISAPKLLGALLVLAGAALTQVKLEKVSRRAAAPEAPFRPR